MDSIFILVINKSNNISVSFNFNKCWYFLSKKIKLRSEIIHTLFYK